MMTGGDVKPFIGAAGRVSDEVREGFVKGSNRVTCVFMKDEEGME